EISRYRVSMDAAHRGDLLMGHASEVSQRGDPGLPLIESHELIEGVTQLDQLPGPIGCNTGFIQFHRTAAGSPFRGEILARMVHEDLAHISRGSVEEVSLISKLDVCRRESEIDLRDQVRRIKHMVAALSSQVTCSQASKLVVHEGIDGFHLG